MFASGDSRGRLVVVSGCMFSGKTHRLIAALHAARQSGRRVRAIKHTIDNRYDAANLVTHDDERFPASAARDAADIDRLAADADVIAIDEGHFFGRELVAVVEQLRAAGKEIHIAGISFNAWGEPFEPMPALTRLADEAEERTCPCRICGAPARYSQRLVPVESNLLVGGAESYEPRCDKCFVPLPGRAPEAR